MKLMSIPSISALRVRTGNTFQGLSSGCVKVRSYVGLLSAMVNLGGGETSEGEMRAGRQTGVLVGSGLIVISSLVSSS
jgi:hypothetical protein